jgi:hypothetical protein
MQEILNGEDFETIQDALKETSGSVEVWVTIKRNTGFTGGTYDGTAPSPTYSQFDVPVTIEEITPEESVQSGGMLSLGDIKMTSVFDVQEKTENIPGQSGTPKESDILIYKSRQWYLVGVPDCMNVSDGQPFIKSYWKRR